jgi:hypothetical protein
MRHPRPGGRARMPAVRATLDPTEGLAHTDNVGSTHRPLHGPDMPPRLLVALHLAAERRMHSRDRLRGHGLSEHRDSYGYVHYERDLLPLLDALDVDRITVAGTRTAGTSPSPQRAALKRSGGSRPST